MQRFQNILEFADYLGISLYEWQTDFLKIFALGLCSSSFLRLDNCTDLR
jgi:hypothetical protein